MTIDRQKPGQIAARGQEIYDVRLRAQLEPQHVGKFAVIDVDSGEFELDADELAALDRAIERFRHPRLFTVRIGFRGTHRLGFRTSASTNT